MDAYIISNQGYLLCMKTEVSISPILFFAEGGHDINEDIKE